MVFRPGYDEEAHRKRQKSEGVLPQDVEDAPEREVHERAREELDRESFDPEGNEAHAPGKVCERCGAVIIAGEDARLRGDGQWVHEVCPLNLSGPPAS